MARDGVQAATLAAAQAAELAYSHSCPGVQVTEVTAHCFVFLAAYRQNDQAAGTREQPGTDP